MDNIKGENWLFEMLDIVEWALFVFCDATLGRYC